MARSGAGFRQSSAVAAEAPSGTLCPLGWPTDAVPTEKWPPLAWAEPPEQHFATPGRAWVGQRGAELYVEPIGAFASVVPALADAVERVPPLGRVFSQAVAAT